MTREIHILTSLRDTTRDAWDACFPNEPEGYDYLLATEDAALHGFQWRYIAAYENSKLIAAAPAFLTDYSLDTTLEGTGKKIASGVKKLFPNLLTLKLACVGSPVTELGQIGFHPSVDAAQKPTIFAAMLEAFETHAFLQGHRLIALKDLVMRLGATLPSLKSGYRNICGMAIATLPITFATMDEYFSSLSAGTRKDMRRKLKSREQLRIESRNTIDDVLPEILALYRATHDRAEMQLEELNAAYFTGVMANVRGASCTLYWQGDTLLAFNLLLESDDTLLDKFFCMDARGREFNLYFVSWFTNLEHCLTRGLKHYQSGAAGYENKLRLGSTLTPTLMYFKHKNRMIQGALRLAAPFFSIDTPPAKEAA